MSALVLSMQSQPDPGLIGGKAAMLARLAALGFDVPPWLVLVPDAFGDIRLREEALGPLAAGLGALGEGPYAVRSSAREEDGREHSHAGQLLTLLDVPAEHVADAAHRVWRSGFTESLARYRAERGIAADARGPAVLVQRMVRARVAGVAFSADPVSGLRDVITIGATHGLGDKLVGGEETGETVRVAKGSLAVLDRIGDQGAPVLAREEARRVAALALTIEERLGAAQDIEWAFEAGRLYLLQARPITTLPSSAVAAPPAARAEPRAEPGGLHDLVIWDNSNIVESYPGVVSPLTFSFARYVYAHAYRGLARLLGVSAAAIGAHRATFETLLGRVDGRVYYNLLGWYRTLALIPGFALNRRFMETMMGVSEALPDPIAQRLAPPPARGLARARETARVARVGLGLVWQAATIGRRVRAFERRLAAALADDPEGLADRPLAALARDYRALETSLLERWDAPLVNDLLCMIAYGASRRLMERWAGAAGIALHNDVLIGQGDIVSAEPARRVREMGRMAAASPAIVAALARGEVAALELDRDLARAATDYLAKFSDRCTEELKLESLPLLEEPTPLLKAIAAAAGHPSASHTAAVDLEQRLATVLPRRRLRRALARRALALAKARVRDRENLRFERTRLFGRVRRIALALGARLAEEGRLASPRDVFFLTIDELLGAAEGWGVTQDLKALAALRKSEHAQQMARPDPPERIEAGPAGRRDELAPTVSGNVRERTGVGASAGVVRGRARVVRDPRQDVVARGEILVARFTDPGWIALFANAAGIVVERGSLLSHSAIVAREMGIPCVVALKGALDWIAPDELIEIDGTSGRVTKRHD